MDMKYRRFFSLAIALVMVFSLGNTSVKTLAAGGMAKITDANSDFNYATEIDGYKIKIKANAGAFKAGTKVKVEAVGETKEKEILEVVKGAEDANGSAFITESFRISFVYNGKIVDPKNGGVEVTIVPTGSFMKEANIQASSAIEKAKQKGVTAVNSEGVEISSKDAICVFEVTGNTATAIDSSVKYSGITVEPLENGIYSVAVVNPVPLGRSRTAAEKEEALKKAAEWAAKKEIDFNKEFVKEYDDYIASDNTMGEAYALKWVLGETMKAGLNAGLTSQAETITINKDDYPVITAPDRRIGVFSNKTLDLGGATLTRSSSKNLMGSGTDPNSDKTSSGYDYYKNIKICNGVVDGGTYDAGIFRFARVTNLTFEKITFTNVSQHAIEVAAVKNLVIRDCVFEKPNYKPSSIKSGYECVSFDMTSNGEGFPGYGKKDYLTCQGAVIENCKFTGLYRGVGSHHFKDKQYYENIVVKDCTFTDIADTAVEGCGWKDCQITNNTFDGVGFGVDFRQTAKQISGGKYTSYTCDNVVDGNTFVLQKDGSKSTNVAVRTGGFTLTKKTNGVAAGKYYVNGYTITNNIISGENTDGISLEYTKNTTVSGNKIAESKGNCIQFVFSEKCTSMNNEVDNGKENGIYIKGSKNIKLDTCTVKNAKKNNVHINNKSSKITVKNCTIEGGECGVCAIDESKNITITGCNISKSKLYGIKMNYKTTGKKIDKNTISGTKNHGIYVSNYAVVKSVSGNTISKVGKKGTPIFISNHAEVKLVKGNKFPGLKKKAQAIFVSGDSKAKIKK